MWPFRTPTPVTRYVYVVPTQREKRAATRAYQRKRADILCELAVAKATLPAPPRLLTPAESALLAAEGLKP